MQASPRAILEQYWGYPAFRPLQEEVIEAVLGGKDTLALMPTGGGKSLCFQVPALARDGLCLVVSPLIALMNDQVRQLRERRIPATAIHSGMRRRDIDREFDNAIYGNTKLLYLSPERLGTALARERIRRMKVNLLAVDEAHCISQWGYDFRPAYLEIAAIRDLLPGAPVLALTATATPRVVADIQEKLAFPEPHALSRSFVRPELTYVVLREEDKEAKLFDILSKVPGSAIVYARSRRKTRDTARYLQRRGLSADFYNAGLDPLARDEKQEAWTRNLTRVMVCTNAFGMGIDKPDVRAVVHLDLPESLEAYFQEAGRGGRDGQRAYATLLYHDNDRVRLEQNLNQAYPELPAIRRVYRALGSYYQLAVGSGEGESFDFDLPAFCQTYDLKTLPTFHALRVLERAGWLVLSDAVYQPGTLQVQVERQQLYDYQLRHPRLDRVIKAVLRNYQGAFSQALAIREGQLANALGLTRDDLERAFRKLEQDGIVAYSPQSEQPRLTWVRERVNADDLEIDLPRYRFLKARQTERMEAALAYAEVARCRSQQLLAYFGEEAEPCGRCDVCLGRTRTDLHANDRQAVRQKVRALLREAARTPEEVLEAFRPAWRARVTQALEALLDEGRLQWRDGRLRWRD